MKIINLIENTKGSNSCLFEHGLSFYIEVTGRKLLIDTGATEAFITNAQKLGVDLAKVDHMILSHGHYDHAGGILAFAQINPHAPIWMQKQAVNEFYHKNETLEKYIGIDSKIKELPSLKLVEGNQKIEEGIFLFSDVTGRKLWPLGNLELMVKKGDVFYQDDFCHEQYLVIEEDGKRVLISGCAHNGILNILDKFKELYGSDPDAVISGFHMQKKSGYSDKDLEIVRETARELKKYNTRFYTGHCTGEVPYEILKEIMQEQLQYVHSGDEIKV